MWLEKDKPTWLNCFNLEKGEIVEKYCECRYIWLVWRGNRYEERGTDGILILTNVRIVFVSRIGLVKKSYVWNHSIGYKGILGMSTGGWIIKNITIQVKFPRKRKIDTVKYIIRPSKLIPEYETFIKKKWKEPIQIPKATEIKKCPKCNKPIAQDFRLCPYCGNKLR